MKKVFSKEKYIKDLIALGFNEEKIEINKNRSWVKECEGLTREEIEKMGYTVYEEWFVEVPDDEVSNYEIFKEINDLLKKLDDLIKRKEKQEEKQELIDYLKEQISNLHWEMSELSLGMCDTKFQEGKLSAYEEILSKIEKSDK